MDLTYRDGREERDFSDAVAVEVSENCHGFTNHRVQIFLFYMSVGPMKANEP